MPGPVRDDFLRPTRTTLAARAGHRCSNPSCRKPTIGPASDDTGYVILGEAAHITAAAPGGPRYNSQLSSEQRKHSDNGLWCCRSCEGLIDKDATGYQVETLRQWKKDAEAAARERLEQSGLPVSLLKGLEALDDFSAGSNAGSNAANTEDMSLDNRFEDSSAGSNAANTEDMSLDNRFEGNSVGSTCAGNIEKTSKTSKTDMTGRTDSTGKVETMDIQEGSSS